MKTEKQRRTWHSGKPTKQANGLESLETKSSSEPKQLESQFNNGVPLTCETLRYSVFKKVCVTEDYSLVGGAAAWIDIVMEYSSLIKTPKSEGILECWKKIHFTDMKIEIVQRALEYLWLSYSKPIAEALQELGFDLIVDIEDVEEYRKQLKALEVEARVLIVLLQQYQNEYEALTGGKDKKTEKRTMMSFAKEEAILRREGYKIGKKITVLEMCGIINAFMEQHKKK